MLPKTGHTSSQAFDLLYDEVEARLSALQTDITETAKRGAYDKVSQLAKTAQELAELKKELAGLEKRYNRLIETEDADEPASGGKHIRKGSKTPQEAYQVPILQALVDLGGRSKLQPVLDRVHEAMKAQLNDHDLAVLSSDGITPRWRNTAQWARNDLREEGLIRDGTPRAIWEISEKGREWLKGQQKDAGRSS